MRPLSFEVSSLRLNLPSSSINYSISIYYFSSPFNSSNAFKLKTNLFFNSYLPLLYKSLLSGCTTLSIYSSPDINLASF